MPPVTTNSAVRQSIDPGSGSPAVAVQHPSEALTTASNLREAQRYLPNGSPEEQAAFVERQLRARSRASLLLNFYRRYPCHLVELHLLATCAVALGRFRGFSPEFDEMGEEFMLTGADGRPRTKAWQRYVEACEAGRPWQVRDEIWIAAHMEDMERVRRSGLEERFRRQAAAHADDPTWQAINQHVEATLGTAFAHSLSATFLRLCTVSWHLVRRYWGEGCRAVVMPAGKSHEGVVSYRRLAFLAARYSFTAWNASRVYRRGMRERDRGRRTSEDGWPLLADVLGPRISDVHPLIVRFYQNPANFQVKVRVDLHTLPAKLWSRVITLLIGPQRFETPLGSQLQQAAKDRLHPGNGRSNHGGRHSRTQF